MRQRHVVGERMFVDYSGTRMTVTDPATGAARPAEIFVAVMGASNMTTSGSRATITRSRTI